MKKVILSMFLLSLISNTLASQAQEQVNQAQTTLQIAGPGGNDDGEQDQGGGSNGRVITSQQFLAGAGGQSDGRNDNDGSHNGRKGVGEKDNNYRMDMQLAGGGGNDGKTGGDGGGTNGKYPEVTVLKNNHKMHKFLFLSSILNKF